MENNGKKVAYFTPDLKKLTAVKVVVMILASALIVATLKFATAPVLKSLDCESSDTSCQNSKRVQTITSISLSFIIAIVIIITVASVLNIVGVHTGSILAGAGIVGLIIGLGAQSIIKDVLNGILIISENQVSVGDYVTVTTLKGNTVEGVVQSLSVRILTLQADDGSMVFIPSGNILHISNYSRTNQVVTVLALLPTDTDLRTLIPILTQLMGSLNVDPKIAEKLVSAPELVGVSSSTDSNYTLEFTAKVKPGYQWMVANYIRLQILQQFQQIRIESPQVFVNLREVSLPSPSNDVSSSTKMPIISPSSYVPPTERPLDENESRELETKDSNPDYKTKNSTNTNTKKETSKKQKGQEKKEMKSKGIDRFTYRPGHLYPVHQVLTF